MDNIMFQDFLITTNDVDILGNIKPISIVNYYQFMAGVHGDRLGVGSDYLAESNTFWILIRQDVRIIKLPKNGQTITLSTWPHNSKGYFFARDFEYHDKETNELLIEGSAIWGIYSYTTDRLIKGDKIIYNCSDFLSKCIVLGQDINFKDNNLGEFCLAQTARNSDLDLNHHVNNTKYLDFAYNCLDLNFIQNTTIKGFHIKYYLQTKLDETLNFYKFQNDNSIVINGLDTDNNKHFTAIFDI